MEKAQVDLQFFWKLFHSYSSPAVSSSSSTASPSSITSLWNTIQCDKQWSLPYQKQQVEKKNKKTQVEKSIKSNKGKQSNEEEPPSKSLLDELQQPSSEDSIQQAMNVVHQLCSADSPLVIRDTSDGSYAPLQPHHKFDHCAVPVDSSSSSCTSRVCWDDIVFSEQLKKSLLDSDLIKEARLQLADDMSEVMDKQSERQFTLGFISDGLFIQFYHFKRTPFSVLTSGLLPFLRFAPISTGAPASSSSAVSPHLSITSDHSSIAAGSSSIPDGFSLYSSLLRCSPLQLGHPPALIPVLPSPILELIDLVTSPTMLRRGDDWKPSVFEVTMKQDGHFAVVKNYPRPYPFARELDALTLLQADSSLFPFIPQLIHTIDQASHHCLFIRPVAQFSLLNAPFTLELFASVVETGWRVLDGLHSRGFVHGDVTPANCLVTTNEAATAAVSSSSASSPSSCASMRCILNDFGSSGRASLPFSRFAGTHDFASPAWVQLALEFSLTNPEADPTLLPVSELLRSSLDDYYSFFFTLLYFSHVSHKRRLAWSDESELTRMWCMKLFLMASNQRETLLRYVRVEVKPFLLRLASAILDQKDANAAKTILQQHKHNGINTIPE
jgi:hypothetical protein